MVNNNLNNMQILLLGSSELDKQAAEKISALSKEDSAKDFFVIDINQTVLTNEFSSQKFAKKLIKNHQLGAIQNIYLCVSEIIPNYSLCYFAHHLANHLKKQTQREIKIHIVSSLNFDITIVMPPMQPQNEWIIYGINRKDFPKELKDNLVSTLSAIPDKKIIWQGRNILDWFRQSQQTFAGKGYAWA